jgi:hypothetical protein
MTKEDHYKTLKFVTLILQEENCDEEKVRGRTKHIKYVKEFINAKVLNTYICRDPIIITTNNS